MDANMENNRLVLNKPLAVSNNYVTVGTGATNEECYEYLSKPPKPEIDDSSTFHLVFKKLKFDESGIYIPAPRSSDESVVVFAWGGRVQNGSNSKVAIGIYWGENHPLNVSRKITGRETALRAKKYAVILTLFLIKQIKCNGLGQNITIYCNYAMINEVKETVKCLKKTTITDDVSLMTIDLIFEGIHINYQYVERRFEEEKGHVGKHGMLEAKKLADTANLRLSTKNVLLQFNNKINNKLNVNQLLAPITATNRVDVKTSASMELLAPIIELSSDEEIIWDDGPNRSTQMNTSHKDTKMELIIPKSEVIDEVFTDVFICGRSFISDCERAGLGIYWKPDHEYNSSYRLSGLQEIHRAEICAASIAFFQAKQLNVENLHVYTDSKFLEQTITCLEKYKRKNWVIGEGFPIIYKKDVISIDVAMTDLKIILHHVKDRNSCLGLVEAERLAVAGCHKIAAE